MIDLYHDGKFYMAMPDGGSRSCTGCAFDGKDGCEVSTTNFADECADDKIIWIEVQEND